MSARHAFCVEADVPIPSQRAAPVRYPWRKMKVGDSFLVAGSDHERLLNSLTSCRAYAQMKTGRKFVCRCIAQGVRVWRVE